MTPAVQTRPHHILTVPPPYASGLIRWGATQMGRKHSLPQPLLGQTILIHCSKNLAFSRNGELGLGAGERELRRTLARLKPVLPMPTELCQEQIFKDQGGILGSIRVVNILRPSKEGWVDLEGVAQNLSPWATPSFPFIWVFEDPYPYSEIEYIRGSANLWVLR